MDGPDDVILNHIRELLGDAAGRLSILEQRVDAQVQLEYLSFARSQPQGASPEDLLGQEARLFDASTPPGEVRALLVRLASLGRPEAYRLLERYHRASPPPLRDWATLALQESRMLLESKLLDERQVFISSGLGGKGGMLRYFVVILPLAPGGFTPTQRKLIRSEFRSAVRRSRGLTERWRFTARYATLLALLPLDAAVNEPFRLAIEECNSLGAFIRKNFLVTNVRPLTGAEILQITRTQSPSSLA